MPNVNNSQLNTLSDSHHGAALASLNKLADSTEGSLHIKDEKGIVSIGVRSWPRYFFEKLFYVDTDIGEIKNKQKSKLQRTSGCFFNMFKPSPQVLTI